MECCEKLVKKNLQERKEFVSANKLCWNCLSKAHFVKQCKSKYKCKIDMWGTPTRQKIYTRKQGETLPVFS